LLIYQKKEDWMKLFLSHIHASFSRKKHSHQYLKIKSIITGQSPFLSIKIKQTQIKMLKLAQIIFSHFFIILMAVKREWLVTKKYYDELCVTQHVCDGGCTDQAYCNEMSLLNNRDDSRSQWSVDINHSYFEIVHTPPHAVTPKW